MQVYAGKRSDVGQRVMVANAETSNTNSSGDEVIVIDASSEIVSLRRLKPRRTVLRTASRKPNPASLLPHPATRYFRHRPSVLQTGCELN
jgi:hypothetical protein